MTAARKPSRQTVDSPHLTIAGVPDPTVEYLDVTPELAEEWLGKNTKNRRTKQAKIGQFVRSMERGEWRMTGEAIKFDVFGNLLDGQNRLTALIESGKTIRFCVMRGLLPEAQDVMDTGAARTVGDQLTIHGHTNATTLGAAASILVLWSTGRINEATARNKSASHAEVIEFVRAHPLLADATAEANRYKNIIKCRPAAVAACYYLMVELDADDASEFLHRVADGANLPIGSPILALRNKLQALADENTRVPLPVYCSLILRAWNAWRAGTEMSKLPAFSRNGVIPVPVPK